MEYKLRPYQKDAVDAGLKIKSGKNGILVLPTGTGKSLIIAEIVKQSGLRTIVLQPTKEILEQNVAKFRAFGLIDYGIFSASMNEKSIGMITFATIGTIIKHKEKFANFKQIIVDECHLVNSKGGQYEDFITSLGKPVIGLTATPFRMKYYVNSFGNNEPVVESRFLTRTRPRIFNTISHITQIPDMFDQGFLCPTRIDAENTYDSKKILNNSTGQGYDEKALSRYNESQGIVPKIVDAVRGSASKHILIFTHFRAESKTVIKTLESVNIHCCEVSGKTQKAERERILSAFKSGEIRCVVNVGVLTVGFDFPELDCIIIGRPLKSLALFYQISGRGLRPAPGKEFCNIIDLCDNIKRFGEINSFVIEDISEGRELWRLKSSKGYLTGVNLISGKDIEKRQMTTVKEKKAAESGELTLPFGKHLGAKISELDQDYMKWCSENFDNGKWKTIFVNELKRRESLELGV
ncbi:MAG: DEAD/DEAH box helicase [Candidatus Levybacteria bacterium]|nr:DEAD/DEAH box helicase [Candidatus Levybacteria bacterium]